MSRITRQQWVDKVREYIGTPMGHQGRMKGIRGRIDCGGLILCAAEELGLVDVYGLPLRGRDHLNYEPQPHGTVIYELCKGRLIDCTGEKWQLGDVLVFRNPVPCHLAVISQMAGQWAMVHMNYTVKNMRTRKVGIVGECLFTHAWQMRVYGNFRIPGVE